jgi:cell division control protein 45
MGYQFTLLDHWSLYESMMHSNYLMMKFNLWEDRGRQRLHEFLQRIGISLSEAKQLYKYMSQESQKKLENFIIPTAESFQLFEVAYMSFVRNVDYSATFMASDFCHILACVLEASPLL